MPVIIFSSLNKILWIKCFFNIILLSNFTHTNNETDKGMVVSGTF